MAFNFNIDTKPVVRNTRQQLKPWNIYDVKFTGCEIREFDGKKDPSQHYKVLAINFENEDGVFSVTNFFPKEGDDVRHSYDGKNGGKVEMPSNFETLMAVVKQTAMILNPKGFEAMQAASSKFKSFDDVAAALIKITDKVKGTETKLKLVGRNRDGKVVADIPRLVGINKEGEAFVADNYIGSKLFFSDYEEGKRAEYLGSKPTDMSKKDNLEDIADEQENNDDEFDLANL